MKDPYFKLLTEDLVFWLFFLFVSSYFLFPPRIPQLRQEDWNFGILIKAYQCMRGIRKGIKMKTVYTGVGLFLSSSSFNMDDEKRELPSKNQKIEFCWNVFVLRHV